MDPATATISVLRLFELLLDHSMVTLSLATEPLKINKVTAHHTIQALKSAHVLTEITDMARDRV